MNVLFCLSLLALSELAGSRNSNSPEKVCPPSYYGIFIQVFAFFLLNDLRFDKASGLHGFSKFDNRVEVTSLDVKSCRNERNASKWWRVTSGYAPLDPTISLLHEGKIYRMVSQWNVTILDEHSSRLTMWLRTSAGSRFESCESNGSRQRVTYFMLIDLNAIVLEELLNELLFVLPTFSNVIVHTNQPICVRQRLLCQPRSSAWAFGPA